MINIGVIGLGSMGGTHIEAYQKIEGCRVVAVADADEQRRTGAARAGGNIEGQGNSGFDFDRVTQYADAAELIADPAVDLVDICLPTPLHKRFSIAALEAGKHLLVEKPLARTAEDAEAIVAAAEKAKGLAMCAMCMRLWPGWDWLKGAVDSGRFGPVLGAQFRRVTSMPEGGFYADGAQSGGALLDLHIHDTDFVRHVFGAPRAVFSRGYSHGTSATDHVVTQYLFEGDAAPAVVAEGGWSMRPGFGFEMQYCVNFERATAVFDINREPVLTLIEDGTEPQAVDLPAGLGYDHELAYLIDCIQRGAAPEVVTLKDAAAALRIIEAEARSIASGEVETI